MALPFVTRRHLPEIELRRMPLGNTAVARGAKTMEEAAAQTFLDVDGGNGSISQYKARAFGRGHRKCRKILNFHAGFRSLLNDGPDLFGRGCARECRDMQTSERGHSERVSFRENGLRSKVQGADR